MKVLITGGRSLLGKSLIETAPPGWSIEGTYFQHPPSSQEEGPPFRFLDVRDLSGTVSAIAQSKAELVLHCASEGDVDFCEKNPMLAMEVNVLGSYHVWRGANAAGARLIYISTNGIFDGQDAPYAETDPPRPVHFYGLTKLLAEDLLRRLDPNVLILRPNLLFGWNHEDHRSNPFTWTLKQLASGRPFQVVNDVLNNPISAPSCAAAVWQAAASGKSGIYHLGGSERISRYEFSVLVAREAGFMTDPIRSASSRAFSGLTVRPADTSFCVRKIEEELGVQPASPEESIRSLLRAKRGDGSTRAYAAAALEWSPHAGAG